MHGLFFSISAPLLNKHEINEVLWYILLAVTDAIMPCLKIYESNFTILVDYVVISIAEALFILTEVIMIAVGRPTLKVDSTLDRKAKKEALPLSFAPTIMFIYVSAATVTWRQQNIDFRGFQQGLPTALDLEYQATTADEPNLKDWTATRLKASPVRDSHCW